MSAVQQNLVCSPAKAGVQAVAHGRRDHALWAPAFAGARSRAHCSPAKAGVQDVEGQRCAIRHWAPAFAGARSRACERGFTLIEMLIALTIFALVSAAGVMMLRASLDTQAAVALRLGESGSTNRLRALLASELATAQPRPGRDGAGAARAAFVGGAGGIAFTHAAAGEPGAGRLHRSSYALENGALVRRGSERLDGGDAGQPAALVRDVASLRWRFRGLDGGWSEQWSVDDPRRLPRAVELTLERRGEGRGGAPLVLRFLVGPDGLPLPGEGGEGEAP